VGLIHSTRISAHRQQVMARGRFTLPAAPIRADAARQTQRFTIQRGTPSLECSTSATTRFSEEARPSFVVRSVSDYQSHVRACAKHMARSSVLRQVWQCAAAGASSPSIAKTPAPVEARVTPFRTEGAKGGCARRSHAPPNGRVIRRIERLTAYRRHTKQQTVPSKNHQWHTRWQPGGTR